MARDAQRRLVFNANSDQFESNEEPVRKLNRRNSGPKPPSCRHLLRASLRASVSDRQRRTGSLRTTCRLSIFFAGAVSGEIAVGSRIDEGAGSVMASGTVSVATRGAACGNGVGAGFWTTAAMALAEPFAAGTAGVLIEAVRGRDGTAAVAGATDFTGV